MKGLRGAAPTGTRTVWKFCALDFHRQFGIGEPCELRGVVALCVAGGMRVRFGGSLFGFGAAVEIEQRIGQGAPPGEGARGRDLAHGAQLGHRRFGVSRVLFQEREFEARVVEIGAKRDGALQRVRGPAVRARRPARRSGNKGPASVMPRFHGTLPGGHGSRRCRRV